MQVTVRLQGVEEALKLFNPVNVTKALHRTLKRAASSGKTIISKQIREKFNIKKKDLDDKIKVDLSGLSSGRAILSLTGKPLNLADFGAREFGKRGKPGSGVRVKILKSKGTTKLKAFMGKGINSGIPLVYRRIPGTQSPYAPISKRLGRPIKREKLKALKVISYPSILRKPENIKAVEDRIKEQLVKEWAANMKYYCRR